MGNTIGRQTLESTGRPIMVTFDGRPEWKGGGITIDWGNVTAVSGSPVTFPDDTVVAVGKKGLRFGTVLYRHTDGTYRVADNTTTLVRDEVAVLNESLLEDDFKSNHPGVIVGGKVWKARLKVGGGTEPTLANLLAALPRLRLEQS